MNNYKNIAVEIVNIIGKENIASATHCATRLRLQVKDRQKIDDDKIRNISEVKGVFFNAGQYQIILGTGIVNKVYQAFVNEFQVAEISKDEMTKQSTGRLQRGIRNLSDVFVPIVPVLGATGLFLGLKGVIFNDTVQAWFGGSVHQVPVALQTLTTVLCDTAFAFLAAFICWSAFKKFGGTPIIGFLIGLMLVSPALPNAYDVAYGNSSPIYVLGFIPLVGYQGSILTALITGIIGAKLEIFFRRVMPNSMDLIFTPFIVILIAVAIALLVLGPLVHAFEHYAVMAIQQFLTLPAGIGGLLIGFIYPIAVMTGMHHMFIMIETSLIAGTGFNPLITVCAMYGFANAAVCLAISLKAKNIAFKTAGISATIAQLLGVSEPALFGIVMQSGLRAIMVMLTSSALGGMVLSLLSIKANSYGLAVLLSPLMYLYDRYQFVTYITVGLAVFIFAFIITFIFVKTDKATKEA
ncbi:PTS transporter subunit EIIC [Klebsiella michiganensis]|nr:PTS transporter subunit EIIC [Klebsiella michiganensis]MBQ4656647.1 PTS transporter subunit EIIC [Klebsiella michiganensis]MBQ4662482.1 PTS transporter subunit EIIC [Klebsiella michiganensis]MDK3151207.1 PTS transporter subunit EIIC [Klebsiella michiganensis]MDV1379105.1 PTS transporter subunit EIIC [Klebsiella michiganensis]MDV1431205.1 PTS transporter subunit EIIC [Klebsiella michiganensis]